MKKILLICLAGCFFLQLSAQKYNDFSHWSIALHGGINQFDGDLKQSSPLTLDSKINFTFGVSVENTITPLYGLGLEYLYVPYAGTDNAPAGYNLNAISHQGSLYGALNILNCFYRERDSKWNLYARVGAGVSYYKADVDISGVPNVTESVPFTWGVFVPVGISLEYNISKSFAIGARVDYRAFNKDNLDGAVIQNWAGVTNDFIGVGTIDLRYKFGATQKDHTRNIDLQTFESSLNKEFEKKLAAADSVLAKKMEELAEKENKIKDLEPRLENLEKMMTTDTDADGVLDYLDKCPNTPAEEKGNVDINGCTKVPVAEVARIAPVVGKTAISQDFNIVYFRTDKAIIRESEKAKLDALIEALKADASAKVIVKGYTDDVASDDYNRTLAKKRTVSVKKYLVDNGIKSNRIIMNAYGKMDFAESNDTSEGRAMNRRVSFELKY